MTESLGDSHRSGRFIWHHLEYFAWTFGFKQGPFQMGPMFSCTHSEVISGGNMFGAVGYLQCNPGQRVVPYNNWWWNVDSLLGESRSRRSWNTSTLLRPGSSALNRRLESHGHKFLGLQRRAAGGLPSLPQKTTMTGPYYGEVLTNLRQAVKERQRGILTRGPLLLHDNAPALMSQVAQAVVKDIGFEQLSHPPHSPGLTPSDFCLFRHLKQHLCGTRFLMMVSCSRPRSRISTTCPGILFDLNKRTFWQMWIVYWCTGRLHWKIMYMYCFFLGQLWFCTSYWIAKLFDRPSY